MTLSFPFATGFPTTSQSPAVPTITNTSYPIRPDTAIPTNMATSRRPSTVHQPEHEGSTVPVRLDNEKIQAFGGRMLTFLNNGALTLMISIGHKLGIFEAMAVMPSASSHQLAHATKLHERYVREWLATMFVGGIVSMADTDDKNDDHRYYLSPEHAAFLTWGRGPENIAVLSQYISILSSFEEKSIHCFKTGTGIPTNEFGDLKSIMAADSAQTIASSLVDWILPLGEALVIPGLKSGIDVLEVECGTGINLITLAKEYPRSWFTGYDSSPANIALAREAYEREKLQNIRFKCLQITESSESSAYDLITCFGGLVETGNAKNVVKRIYQALRLGGTFLLQDVAASSDAKANRGHPAGPLLYTISVMFSVPSTIFKTGNDEEAVGIMWGNDRALSLVRDVGFKCDGVRQLPDDLCNVFFFCSRD